MMCVLYRRLIAGIILFACLMLSSKRYELINHTVDDWILMTFDVGSS
jgi:hypothetical protein